MWVQILKAIKEVKDHLDTLRDYKDAVDRLKEKKEPFPPPENVQKQLRANEALSNKLTQIRLAGLPEPKVERVGLDALSNPGTRVMAQRKLREALQKRREHVQVLKHLLNRLAQLEKEAKLKAEVAREARDFWGDMIQAPLPDVGSLNKTTYFGYYEVFTKLSGSIGNVARNCERARQRLAKDLQPYAEETDNMAVNMKTFGIAVAPTAAPQVY